MLKILVFICLINHSFGVYNEKYRPQFHYSPPTGWMNDPNGLVYHNGVFHLFFQYWITENQDGPKKDWGHAVSTDLFHWKTLPIALTITPEGQMIWSGSAIIDAKNVTGYQNKNNPNQTMVAIFTAFHAPEGTQTQWMAYSTDTGIKWNFYEHNPIIGNPKIPDFRDPKVFSFNDYYVIVVTAGNHIKLYNSTDLKHWTLMSEFGQNEGSHAGVWECTDLFQMTVTAKNGTKYQKWILTVNGGGRTQYFIGSFDGHKFTNENPKEKVLWVEDGPDSYAGVTYNSAPDNRRIFIAWMTGMAYLGELPTSPWRGQMTLPRDMNLVETSEHQILLASVPAPEISKLRANTFTVTHKTLDANQNLNINKLTTISSKLLDIELSADISHFSQKDKFGIEFSGVKDKLKVYFDGSFGIDRTNAGRHDFSNRFSLVNTAPRRVKDTTLNLRLVLDISSIELFADNGLTVMTSLFFSEDNLSSNVTLFYESSNKNNKIVLDHFSISQMKSIW